MALTTPPKNNLAKQLLMSAVVLLVAGVIVAIVLKFAVGLIIFLLGAIAGIGGQVANNSSLTKDK